ncbi:hypothetical protein [Ciceribacter lividus]|uniref:hypothetical protein n=1 Tax=Ciceribacter lividus TaxID=1197950 RepID=UPI0011C035D0|nr:hypothetical protein [Ciceribacter lividus]
MTLDAGADRGDGRAERVGEVGGERNAPRPLLFHTQFRMGSAATSIEEAVRSQGRADVGEIKVHRLPRDEADRLPGDGIRLQRPESGNVDCGRRRPLRALRKRKRLPDQRNPVRNQKARSPTLRDIPDERPVFVGTHRTERQTSALYPVSLSHRISDSAAGHTTEPNIKRRRSARLRATFPPA